MTFIDERRPDIDWLRVLATLLVVVFHAAMVFNPAPFYHVRNAELSFAMVVFCGFVSLWHMPLFFVLAGWSLARALARRSALEVLRERLARIGIPLATGIVMFMPAIKYLELRSGLDLNHRGLWVTEARQPGFRSVIPVDLPTMPEFRESFAAFLPTFFTDLDRFTWAHLWFIAYLLVFTLLLLPVFATWSGMRRRAADVQPWMAWAPLPLLVTVQLLLRPHWPGVQNLYNDWANVAWYVIFLVAGFALGNDADLEAVVHRQWRRGLAVGAVTCVVLLGGITGVFSSERVLLAGSAVAAWSFVVALLGVGRRRLSFSTPALRYLSEAALPVYVLHQAAVVVPGFWLVQLPLGIAGKLLLLVVVAFVLVFGAYEFLVRRIQPLRILFGMRPLACPLRTPPAGASGAAVAVLALFVAGASADAATQAGAPTGLWYAEGGAAQVELRRCGSGLCGRVVWLRSPFDENGCPMQDRWNPDPSLRSRPLVGIDILGGLRPVEAGRWDGGTIYDPTTGRTYSCAMTMDSENGLLVRGYLGFHVLGRTTRWLRVGSEARECGG